MFWDMIEALIHLGSPKGIRNLAKGVFKVLFPCLLLLLLIAWDPALVASFVVPIALLILPLVIVVKMLR